MKCPHCLENFHAQTKGVALHSDEDMASGAAVTTCPACGKFNIILSVISSEGKTVMSRLVFPASIARSSLPSQVPEVFAVDYLEACTVLTDSPKSSAALSRRCLQALLRDAGKTKAKDLNDQIDEVIASKSLPSFLSDAIDSVRVLGNFAAHPLKSKNTGEIVEVEPGEAEWCLDTLEGLFDFYFVQPELLRKKRDALNQKIAAAGKPQLKS